MGILRRGTNRAVILAGQEKQQKTLSTTFSLQDAMLEGI
jgi:hypothetical protein